MLWEKRLQAKQWLDKLKKTMSAPKGNKRAPSMRSAQDHSLSASQPPLAPGEGEREREGDKSRPLLSDMKMMVMEGESLLSSDATDRERDGDDAAVPAVKSTVSSRELCKAQTVVEVAEEVTSPYIASHHLLSPDSTPLRFTSPRLIRLYLSTLDFTSRHFLLMILAPACHCAVRSVRSRCSAFWLMYLVPMSASARPYCLGSSCIILQDQLYSLP